MSRSTADVIVDGLKRAGTPRLLGVSGERGPVALLEAARAGELPVTLASGPAAAGVMAAVTGDLVEAPGAVVIGSGGGVTPAVDGVAHALSDRHAMILLTDRLSGTLHACKASLSVTAATAAHWIAHAARLAATEPRGPVHLEIPAEVARQPALPLATSCRPDPLPVPDPGALDAAARLLGGASRPLLVAGLHCRSSSVQQWVRAFAEALPAPMLATFRAKGALPDPHPLMLGVLGGDGIGEALLARADLVVGLGLDALELARAPWWSTLPVLALGPPQALGDRVPALDVVGELAAILEELAPRLRDGQRADWDVAELDRLKRAASAAGTDPALARRALVRIAREATPAGTIAAVDAGPHLLDVAVAWDAVAPREFLVSNGHATAGFALPAALAAHLVHPDRPVLCFTATDGLTAATAELETATRLGAPVVVIVFGDLARGAVDLARLASSAGVTASAAEGPARFGEALGLALGAGGPALIAVGL